MFDLYDEPFQRHGLAGAFAYGVMKRATGDGERAAWTVCAPIGVICRPKPPMKERPPYEPAPRVDAQRLLDAAAPLFGPLLRAVGAFSDSVTWAGAVAQARKAMYVPRGEAEIAAVAYFGFGERAAGVQTRLPQVDEAGWPATSAVACFGFMLHDCLPLAEVPCTWHSAVRAAEFVASLVPVMGEAGWTEVERLAELSRRP